MTYISAFDYFPRVYSRQRSICLSRDFSRLLAPRQVSDPSSRLLGEYTRMQCAIMAAKEEVVSD